MSRKTGCKIALASSWVLFNVAVYGIDRLFMKNNTDSFSETFRMAFGRGSFTAVMVLASVSGIYYWPKSMARLDRAALPDGADHIENILVGWIGSMASAGAAVMGMVALLMPLISQFIDGRNFLDVEFADIKHPSSYMDNVLKSADMAASAGCVVGVFAVFVAVLYHAAKEAQAARRSSARQRLLPVTNPEAPVGQGLRYNTSMYNQ